MADSDDVGLLAAARARLDAALAADTEALAAHEERLGIIVARRRSAHTGSDVAVAREAIALLRLGDLAIAERRDEIADRLRRTGEGRRAGQAYAASARRGI